MFRQFAAFAFLVLSIARPAAGEITRIWLTHKTNDPSRIVVNWETEKPGNSVVRYGASEGPTRSIAIEENVTLHHVEIPLDRNNTTYHYRVSTGTERSAGATFKAYPTDVLRVAIVADWQRKPNLDAVLRDNVHLLLTAGDNIGNLHQLCGVGIKDCTKPYGELIDTQAAEVPGEPAAPAVPTPCHESLPTVPGVEVPVGWARRVGVSDADLQLIENRCRLKAEGARWAATRQRRTNDGADYYLEIEPADRDIITRAKALEDCFLWMNHPSAPTPYDLKLWEDVAGCFDVVANVISLLRQLVVDVEKNRGLFEQALDLAAEAQSALRMVVETVGGRPDNDQDKLFNWLRHTATEHQIFIRRFLRLDDPADPDAWNELQERISDLDAQAEAIRKQEKQRESLLGKGKYHARRIREGNGSEEDWKKVVGAVESLINDGIPPSNTDIREMLVPIVDWMPDDMEVPLGFQRVLVEIDRYLATQAPPSAEIPKEVPKEVEEAAELLKGKAVVIIGGDRRPHAHEALKSAFGLKELIWISTREHESVEQFEPYVARTDVNTVLLAIRWSSHSYGEVRDYCEKHGKHFVRLPGGYNPNQVAHQVLQQRGGT